MTGRKAETFAILLALFIGWDTFDIAMGTGSAECGTSLLAQGSAQASRDGAKLAVLISAFVWVTAIWAVIELSRVLQDIGTRNSN